MDNYYKEIIKEIRKYIDNNDYKEALLLLQEELKMPYIPLEEEKQIIDLYNEVNSYFRDNNKKIAYSLDNLEELLNSDLYACFAAVELLKDSNVRKYIKEIEEYFIKSDHNPLVVSLIIEILIAQQISDSIKLNYYGDEIDFLACFIEPPLESDGAIKVKELLEEYFSNDDPIFLEMCFETMVKELYLRLPINIDEDESEIFAIAIVEYVYKANNDEEKFNEFILNKNLAKSSGYDLLLYKYDI